MMNKSCFCIHVAPGEGVPPSVPTNTAALIRVPHGFIDKMELWQI